MARHGAEQRALADAAAAEDADALALAAGQQRVDGADAGDQRLRDVLAVERVGGGSVQAVGIAQLRSAGPPSIGLPKPSITRPSRPGPTSTRASSTARRHGIAQLQAVDFLQRHGEHAPVAEADHLGANAPAAGGLDLAKIADGHARAARFDQQADHLGHLARPAQRRDAVQLRRDRARVRSFMMVPPQAVGQAALDFLKLRFHRGIQVAALASRRSRRPVRATDRRSLRLGPTRCSGAGFR